MKKEQLEKLTHQYTSQISSKIAELFDEEEGSLTFKEISDNERFKCFVFALSCASAIIFNKLSNSEKTYLEFNHMANMLCFEFMKHAD